MSLLLLFFKPSLYFSKSSSVKFERQVNKDHSCCSRAYSSSGIIYAVPFYRVIESAAFFTVPLAVFLAIKNSQNLR